MIRCISLLFFPLKLLLRYVYKQYLFGKIQSRNYDKRFEAVYALKEKYGPSSIPGLIYILNHKNCDIRHDAAYCLELITGAYNGDSYKKWRSWWKRNKKKIRKNR